MSFVDLDEFPQRLDTEIGKSHDAIVAEVLDPDQSILLIHVYGDVPQPILVFTEHCRHPSDRGDVVDFVGRRHGQAARTMAAPGLGFQFQGSNSSSRCAGWEAIRASTSANQACGSTSFIFAVTIML